MNKGLIYIIGFAILALSSGCSTHGDLSSVNNQDYHIKSLRNVVTVDYIESIGNSTVQEIDVSFVHKIILNGFNKRESTEYEYGNNLLIFSGSSVVILKNYKNSILEEIDYHGYDVDFMDFDYGIYWMGKNGEMEKAIPGRDNPYYDPEKPTIIYAHGWQPGRITAQRKENFNWISHEGPDKFIADSWVDKGWNIAIFYWNMFADELYVRDAEAKIWTTEGDKGMNWVSSDGVVHESDIPRSVSRLFFDCYTSFLDGNINNSIRLAGHSLGHQLATILTYQLYNAYDSGLIGMELLPKRLSLLDPFWSFGTKDYLGDRKNGDVENDLIIELAEKNVAIDAYQSSGLTAVPLFGDNYRDIFNNVVLIEQKPQFFEFYEMFSLKHTAGAWLYFDSIDYPEISDDSGSITPSAVVSDEYILNAMTKGYSWVQSEGELTKNQDDDIYSRYID